MTDKDFDPRFDPAFQPGYDPAKTPRVSRVVEEVPAESEPAVAADQVIAVLPSAPSAGARERPAAAVALRKANPLLVALWVLSVLFVASGVYGLRLIGDRVNQLGANGGFGGSDYYLLQAYTVGAPLLIVLGLATATGTLFLLAARWKKPAE